LPWGKASGVAFLVPFFSTASIYTNYQDVKHRLLALRRGLELKRALPQEAADRHCDLAEALLRLSPPRLNEALEHFQKALEMSPGHKRAKEGIEYITTKWEIKQW
jgi:tetratricopeptide (TPR) repeat protein